jgi:hypothetical protein
MEQAAAPAGGAVRSEEAKTNSESSESGVADDVSGGGGLGQAVEVEPVEEVMGSFPLSRDGAVTGEWTMPLPDVEVAELPVAEARVGEQVSAVRAAVLEHEPVEQAGFRGRDGAASGRAGQAADLYLNQKGFIVVGEGVEGEQGDAEGSAAIASLLELMSAPEEADEPVQAEVSKSSHRAVSKNERDPAPTRVFDIPLEVETPVAVGEGLSEGLSSEAGDHGGGQRDVSGGKVVKELGASGPREPGVGEGKPFHQAGESSVLHGSSGRGNPTSVASKLQGEPGWQAANKWDGDPNVGRVMRGVHSALSQNGGTVTLRLTPADLGVVRIQMRLEHGTFNAQIQTESESVSALLKDHLGQLKQAVETQGLVVERLQVQTVSPGTTSFSDRQSDGSEGDGRSRGGLTSGGQGQDGRQPDRGREDDGRDDPVMRREAEEALNMVA